MRREAARALALTAVVATTQTVPLLLAARLAGAPRGSGQVLAFVVGLVWVGAAVVLRLVATSTFSGEVNMGVPGEGEDEDAGGIPEIGAELRAFQVTTHAVAWGKHHGLGVPVIDFSGLEAVVLYKPGSDVELSVRLAYQPGELWTASAPGRRDAMASSVFDALERLVRPTMADIVASLFPKSPNTPPHA